ncbi:MAG: hypothetical protein M3Z06_00700 [Actinomycetota bacterium]|nr:hypothetical protein [Actinomycetota bacterium]
MFRILRRRSFLGRRALLAVTLIVLAAGAATLAVVLSSSNPPAPRTVMSIFQDDRLLLYSPGPTVQRTVARLKSLGVDRLRVTVTWAYIAPAPTSRRRPPGFDATNPADYRLGGWGPYDRLALVAAQRGIALDFDVTVPGPLWAMAGHPPSAHYAANYRASPTAFAQFVTAVGKRYSGHYQATLIRGAKPFTLPRVSFWTIWNEPNQPGWLAPQWRRVAGRRVQDASRLYRAYLDGAFSALAATGHRPATDTILIGELAPEGCSLDRPGSCPYPRPEQPIPPIPFLQGLYCVDGSYRPLSGASATALHCPPAGSRAAFVRAHPALFAASGFAHHPYSFFLAPGKPLADPEYVPLADLSRLEGALDRVYGTYRVHRQLPIYLTEYGYESDPPDPTRGVPLATQAAYLDQAEFLAWTDPRVKALSQFLLADSAPNTQDPVGSPGYWSTFQTGLEFLNGRLKPSLRGYGLPIFLPDPVVAAEGTTPVWGMLRRAPNSSAQRAEIEWRPRGGRFRPVASVSTENPDGFFEVAVKVPASGALRIAWTSAAGQVFYGRAAPVGTRRG